MRLCCMSERKEISNINSDNKIKQFLSQKIVMKIYIK